MASSTPRPKRRAAQKVANYTEPESTAEYSSQPPPLFGSSTTNFSTPSSSGSNMSTGGFAINLKTPENSRSGTRGNTKIFNGSINKSKDSTTFIRSEIPNNYQPPNPERFPIIQNLSKAKFIDDVKSIVEFDDKLTITKNDHIYMISEPAGEPYYIARVMGFEKKNNLRINADLNSVDNYMIKVNWYYRPRDILRSTSDSRLLYASMHSDLCPVSSFRGKVTVKFKEDIPEKEINEYRDTPHCFYFEKLFDRYMIKYYDILSTKKLVNLPVNYQKALVKRFAYVFVEAGRGSDLLVTPKNCVKCNQWCSMSDSVECAKCKDYYHMLCLTPPLLKKPSRGYSWSCAKCSKETEDEMRISRKHLLEKKKKKKSIIADSYVKEEEIEEDFKVETSSPPPQIPNFEKLAIEFLEKDKNLTLKERRSLEEWPCRYLGMHARLEDALDLDDRPYPRASSRLGNKHQASIDDWFGRPEVYYDTSEVSVKKKTHWKQKKREQKNSSVPPSSSSSNTNNTNNTDDVDSNNNNNNNNTSISTVSSNKKLELPEDYKNTPLKELPPWIKPRPEGYKERGLDDGSSSTLMWKQPPASMKIDNEIDSFIFKKCRPIAKDLKLYSGSPNLLDAIFKTLLDTNFDFDKSFQIIKGFTRESLKEPTFTPEEVERFEDGVREFGSELLPVSRKVGTQPFGMIVRFYYLWKKTPNGHLIWDNFEGRKNKKIKKSIAKGDTVDSIGDADDDSSYDNDASIRQRRKYQCKFCENTHSMKWHRAPGHPIAPSDPTKVVIALCSRCARLWRFYSVHWEDPFEVQKKMNLKGIMKKKLEFELTRDSIRILEEKEKAKLNRSSNPVKRKSSSPALDDCFSTNTTPNKKSKTNKSSTKSSSNSSNNTSRSNTVKIPLTNSAPVEENKKPKSRSNNKDNSKKKRDDSNTSLTLKFTAPPLSENDKKKTKIKKDLDDEDEEDEEDEENITPTSKPKNEYVYNNRFTYNFVNFDKSVQEFDNPPAETAKEDYTIPLSPKTKASNSKDSLGIRQIISKTGLFAPDKRPCCVCRITGDLDEVLICSNCGLNVHASCYGVPVVPNQKMYCKEWCCDSCSNDLHPVCSTYYGCSLCFSKEIDHDSSIVGAPTAFPDALKRTSGFKWSHIICSIFSSDIKFEDTKTLQSVVNTPVALLKNDLRYCDICRIKSGLLKKCSLCQFSVHVTCAQDSSNYSLGFKLNAATKEDSDTYISTSITNDFEVNSKSSKKLVQILKNGQVGIPEPIIICNEHTKENNPNGFKNVYSLREKCCFVDSDETATPLIKLYVEGFMNWEPKVRGPALRFLEYLTLKEENNKNQYNGGGRAYDQNNNMTTLDPDMLLLTGVGANPPLSIPSNVETLVEGILNNEVKNEESVEIETEPITDSNKNKEEKDEKEEKEKENQICSMTGEECKYCGIIRLEKWWIPENFGNSNDCSYCNKKKSNSHFLNFNDVDLNGNLYGIHTAIN